MFNYVVQTLSVLRIWCTAISEAGETSQGFVEKWWFHLRLGHDLLTLQSQNPLGAVANFQGRNCVFLIVVLSLPRASGVHHRI